MRNFPPICSDIGEFHKWEQIQGERVGEKCGLASSIPYYTQDDKLIHCANYQKAYQAKPKAPRKGGKK